MQRKVIRVVFPVICLFFALPLFGQETRSYDGYGNNISNNKEWGSANTPLLREIASVGYTDGMGEMDPTLPQARVVSNTIFNQSNSEDFFAKDSLSDYVWAFGQFLDHDISLVSSGDEPIALGVPSDDPIFNGPIPTTRDQFIDGTGTEAGNPRQFSNNISAYIDGSNVYGSDKERADWLRTFEGGKLKTSDGDLLPWNTVDHTNYNSNVDSNAPHMESPEGFSNKLFVAGDVRANENLILLSIHTLFVREHNRICEALALAHPTWNDEQIYQHARRTVIALIQKITYYEWLPSIGIRLGQEMPAYQGYNEDINAGIFNIFSAAAFRMGHTLIGNTIVRVNNDGSIYTDGHIPIQFAFFNPQELLTTVNGVDVYFKGMATHVQQEMDCKVVSGLRNFLFAPQGSTGFDLASLNIFRGRDRGLPAYNNIRTDMGLPRIDNFLSLTGDAEEAEQLESIYGDIDRVEAWVGLLAENKMPDAMIGELLMDILVKQFKNLRDGDRFYFENDVNLSSLEKEQILNTHFQDVIMRNTGISLMQKNVFKAMPHEEIPSGPFITPIHLEGIVYPNPVVSDATTLKLYSNQEGEASIHFMDATGQVLDNFSYSVISGDNFIPINFGSDLPRGLYFIQVILEDQHNTIQLIREY